MDMSNKMKTFNGMEIYDEAVRAQVNGIKTDGTGAAYIATAKAIDALVTGVGFIMIPHAESTTTSPTLNVNNLGAKPIMLRLSSLPKSVVPLPNESFISANRPIKVVYDGNDAANCWVIEDMVYPNAKGLYGIVPIESGGTNADNAEQARVNLGITTSNNTIISQNFDYAEVYEWDDGNPSNEDRTGYFVTIKESDGDSTTRIKIVKAKSTSDIIGVVVTNPAFSCNCTNDKFDENGELLKQYSYVAIMGIASVIDNGECEINGNCMSTNDGTAVPSSNNMGYHVVGRVDSSHILIVVKPCADMIMRIKDDIINLQNNKSDKTHKHSADDITSGVLSIERGGTSSDTAVGALHSLGITWGIDEAPSIGTPNTIYIQLKQ